MNYFTSAIVDQTPGNMRKLYTRLLKKPFYLAFALLAYCSSSQAQILNWNGGEFPQACNPVGGSGSMFAPVQPWCDIANTPTNYVPGQSLFFDYTPGDVAVDGGFLSYGGCFVFPGGYHFYTPDASFQYFVGGPGNPINLNPGITFTMSLNSSTPNGNGLMGISGVSGGFSNMLNLTADRNFGFTGEIELVDAGATIDVPVSLNGAGLGDVGFVSGTNALINYDINNNSPSALLLGTEGAGTSLDVFGNIYNTAGGRIHFNDGLNPGAGYGLVTLNGQVYDAADILIDNTNVVFNADVINSFSITARFNASMYVNAGIGFDPTSIAFIGDYGTPCRLAGQGNMGSVVIYDQGTIAPGPGLSGGGPGTLNMGGTMVFSTNGAYEFEINDENALPGAGADHLSIVQGMDFSALGTTAGTRFTIKVITLNAGNTPGMMPSFDFSVQHEWILATAAGGYTAFDPAKFDVDASGFQNSLGGGHFEVDVVLGNLVLRYVPAINITTTTLSPSGPAFCIDEGTPMPMTVDFTYAGVVTFNAGNIFYAELSDENGVFGPGRDTIGMLVGNGTTTTVNVAIPDDIPSGSKYHIRIISTNPPANDVDSNITDLTISISPDAVIQNISGSNICGLRGVLRADSLPASSGATGMWTQTGGPGVATFLNPTKDTTTVDVTVLGAYTFAWTTTPLAPCVTQKVDNVTLNFAPQPTANAGSYAPFCSTSLVLTGSVSGGATASWSTTPAVSATFADVTNPTTTASFSASGSPTFTLLATAPGGCTATSTTVINVTVPFTPDAGADTILCGLSGNMAARFIPVTAVGTWTQILGPAGGTATFTSPNARNTAVSANIVGSYRFRWTINDGPCNGIFDDVNVAFQTLHTVSVGTFAPFCASDTTLTATITSGTYTSATWVNVSGPGTVTFTPVGSLTPIVSFPTSGTYVVGVRVANGFCVVQTNQTYVLNVPLQQANAGPNVSVCGLTSVLNGNAAVLPATNTWKKASASDFSIIPFLTSPSTPVTVPTQGTYMYTWEIKEGLCVDTDNVVYRFYEPNFPINAGPDIVACGFNGALNADQPVYGTGSWSLASGPGTALFTDATNPKSGVTVGFHGTYQFVWTINNGPCQKTDTINYTAVQGTAGTADAGSDQQVCGRVTTLAGNTAITGGGQWTLISGPSTAISFSDVTSPTSQLAVFSYGTYVLRWTLSDALCSSFDEVSLTFNKATDADAGPGIQNCGLTAHLEGVIPTFGTGVWTQVSGPGILNFTDATYAKTLVRGTTPGVYTVRWTVGNGTCAVSDDIQLSLQGLVVAAAGADQQVCGSIVTLTAGVPGASGQGKWTVESAPGPVSFSDDHANNSTAQVTVPGSYILRWTTTVGACSAYDLVRINYLFNGINAGNDVEVCGLAYTLSATDAGSYSGTWNFVSGPGTAVFNSTSQNITTVNVSKVGTYKFEWKIADLNCSFSDTIEVTFNAMAVAYAGPRQHLCGLTADLDADHPGMGRGEWAQVGGPSQAIFGRKDTSSTSITVTKGGLYVFRWYVINPECITSDTVSIYFDEMPANISAGPDVATCKSTITINAAVPTAGEGFWTIKSGAASLSSNYSPTIYVNPASSRVVLEWTVYSGVCEPKSDSMVITALPSDPTNPTLAVYNSNPFVCSPDSATFTAIISGLGAAGGTINWYKNGVAVGSGGPTLHFDGRTSSVSGGDVIQCQVKVLRPCLGADTMLFSGPIVLQSIQRSNPQIIISVDNTNLCKGGNVQFTSQVLEAGSAPKYQWYANRKPVNNAVFPTYTHNAPANTTRTRDTVFCVVTGSEPCASYDKDSSMKIILDIKPLPSPSFVAKRIAPKGSVAFQNFSTNTVSFQWHFGDGFNSSQIAPTYQYKASGTYNVCLEAKNECGIETFCRDTITIKVNGAGLAEEAEQLEVNVVPNPVVDGHFTIKGENIDKSLDILLLDATGKTVLKETLNSSGSKGILNKEIDVSALPAGPYLLRMQSGDRAKTIKMPVIK